MRFRLAFVVAFAWAAALGILVPVAQAQNPAWPNASATQADLMDPANWPDNPSYGYDISGTGMSCTAPGGTCWTGASGGQWNMWSWVPPQATHVTGFRTGETAMGAGTWTDMAWRVTTGDKRVVIAVLDSGIEWDDPDLTNQFYINRAELEATGLDPLCLPTPPPGHTGDPVDLDGDGVLSMRDYFVGLSPADAMTKAAAIDAMGNHNGIADPGDLIIGCSNGTDDDGNGYVDDISGWDFFQDDNDPADDTRFGHGTGEARWSVAEANNGIGRAGFCPGCRVLMVRAGDSFIADGQDYGQGVAFATDSGAHIIQEALGVLSGSTYMRRAQDYAYDHDVLIVASAADENSRHHNLPGTSNHTLYVHAVTFAGGNPQAATSYLAYNNCTNYGAQLVLSAPGEGCSSEATAVTAGIAGLVDSESIDPARPGGPLESAPQRRGAAAAHPDERRRHRRAREPARQPQLRPAVVPEQSRLGSALRLRARQHVEGGAGRARRPHPARGRFRLPRLVPRHLSGPHAHGALARAHRRAARVELRLGDRAGRPASSPRTPTSRLSPPATARLRRRTARSRRGTSRGSTSTTRVRSRTATR